MLLSMGVKFQFSPLPHRGNWNGTAQKNKPARAESGQKDQDGGQLPLNDAIQYQLWYQYRLALISLGRKVV